jgi:hypothetical protein
VGARRPDSLHCHQRRAAADWQVLIYAYPGRPGEPGSGFENCADAHVGHPDDLGSWRR